MEGGRRLRAGALEAEFRGGDLWHIRLGGVELVERVYMALRDRNWGTVAGRIEGLSIADRGRGFAVHFDCIHQRGDTDFRWRCTMLGTEAGEISISMDGKAQSTFLRNRIGFCVHHPLRTCAGRPCVVETSAGRRIETAFPEHVAPRQPFRDIRAMSYEAASGAGIEIRFHGEIFETEDQRNWTDSNYKTYGTPLDLPFPVEVPAGTQISQMVRLKPRGEAGSVPSATPGVVRIRETGGAPAPLPKLGLAFGRGFSRQEAAKLRQLKLSHLRVDLDLDSGAAEPLLEQAAAAARSLGVKLEAAITLPGNLAALGKWKALVERWLVFHDGEQASSASTMRAARQALGKDAFLVTGTNANFAELNRNRPSGGDWDAACFSVNPQVHAFDDESVMANTDGQYDVVRSAQRFLGGRPVIVSPVTLRPRFYPTATSHVEAPPPDPRQMLPFCAAWTVGSLRSLVSAGALSVTYFECGGPGGLLDGERTYPVFDVFLAAGDFAGGSVPACESSEPGRVCPLLLAAGARRTMLIANRTAEAVRVGYRGSAIELPPFAANRIDWAEG